MKTVDLIQGSPEWHAHRATHFNASDAPAMMGVSTYQTRTQLMTRLKTGITADVDEGTQRRFDDGHRFEALARPLAEAIIGEELYPVTASEGKYSASFDGLTLMGDVAFEHKTLNDDLRAAFEEMDHLPLASQEREAAKSLHPMYRIQMEHQCMVSGADRVLFMATKWDGDELVAEHHCWYFADLALRGQIVAGWEQLAKDLKTNNNQQQQT
jgi:putative phage-type endonuclease